MQLCGISWRAGLGVFCLILSGCAQNAGSAKGVKSQKDGNRLKVKAYEVKRWDIKRTVEAVGSFLPFEEVNVSSEVEGRIDKIYVDLGDRVQRGQVLLSIAPEELQYELDARVAALRQGLARLGLEGEKAVLKNETDVPEVKKAAAELQQAKLNYDRARELILQALIPKQQLDDAEAKFNSARATYEATIQQVRVTEASVSQSQAEVEMARKKLRDTQIKAPFAGWIKERLVSPGQYLKVQAPVYTIIDTSRLKFSGAIPEKMAPWIHVGGSVQLQVEAFPDRTFEGKITRINPASNEQSRSFSIEALIDNREGLLKPGFFAKASILTDKQESVLTVPASALLYNYGVYRVFVIQGNRVGARDVTLGGKIEGEFEITQGVKEDELVAVSEVPKLIDGMEVAPDLPIR